ncbi:response regulator [Paenibacillus sp. UNC451MF]|uniref:response regulator n=1 Tax=Paenibacillus sp. UNC451MF TaxID=1449063 RepID=UPI00048C1044|nr:response regulator [Paenibacillus sp. UNC451MF]
MYNILIVDDEKIEREGIKLLIRQYKLPFQMAEAENGLKALQYLQMNPVDLLLTDIKMPFMDGMQLAAEARKLDPSLQILFLSAYGEFHYAKQALQLQAANYILKPVEIAEFLNAMQEGAQRCEERRRQQLLELLHGRKPSMSRSRCWNVFPYKRMMVMESRLKFFDTCSQDIEQILREVLKQPFDYINLNEFQSLLLFQDRLCEGTCHEELDLIGRRLQAVMHKWFQSDFFIVFSCGLYSEESFYSEWSKMEKLLETRFFSEAPFILFTESSEWSHNGPTDSVDALVERVQAALEQKDLQLGREELGRLFLNLENSTSFSTIYVKHLCMLLVKYMVIYLRGYVKKSVQEAAQDIYHCHNLTELKGLMLRFLEESIGGVIHDDMGMKPGRKNITHVLEIIHTEYQTDIHLEQIAERVYLSPSYLSYLFKKETGLSLVKYVTQYRMEKAKHYLSSTNMKIVDIGHEVGYTNLSYFGALFKNYVGVSPAQYREESP